MGDIYLPWNGTESEKIKFVSALNKKYTKVKCEFDFSRNIKYIDIKIHKDRNSLQCTLLYESLSTEEKKTLVSN